jgi:biotin carboxyl carrier protein
MSDALSSPLVARIAALAEFLAGSDLLRLRIEREGEEIELGRRPLSSDEVPDVPADLAHQLEGVPHRLQAIKSDLVGVFHLSRPHVSEGDLLEADRELAYIEALGIRNPVRSLGAGRIVSIKRADGEPVEYGAVLFELDRG